MSPQENEELLVDKAKHRDQDALIELVRLHSQTVLNDLHRKFPSLNGTCEQIVNSLPGKLWNWKKLDQLHAPALPLLIKVARNEAITSLRQRVHECALTEDALTAYEAKQSSERAIIESIQLTEVLAAVDELPPAIAQAVLAYLEEKDYKEAARQARCSQATYFKRIRRGVELLRIRFSLK